LIGAYLFGGVTVLQLNLQAAGVPLLDILPTVFIITAIILFLHRFIAGKVDSLRSLNAPFLFVIFACVALLFHWLNWEFNDALWLSASPYLATIVVLVIISAGGAPASLGKTFHASR